MDIKETYQQYKKAFWLGGAAIIVVVLIVVFISYASWSKNITNDGEGRQERVEQTYKSAQNSLSTCLDQGKTAAQVSEQEFTRLKEILVDVTSARYVDENGNDTDASTALGEGRLFSAVIEAYPTIDQTSFQNLQAVVVGCRDEYQGAQDRLQNEIREFETWFLTDSVFNSHIKGKFPTNELDALNFATGEVLVAEEALAYMDRVILVGDAKTAYNEGELGEQDLFGD